MKKGFTLIELLIVVTVMATLMTIMFKLSAVSQDETRRITTITRMQRIENCLSGYFSAFGSYPPVRVYGTRDIYTKLEGGVQTDEREPDKLRWDRIEAACRSQPVDCAFPFAEDMRDTVEQYSKDLYEACKNNPKFQTCSYRAALESGGFSIPRYADLLPYKQDDDWRAVQVFKFGVLSYILPRYLVMMRGEGKFYGVDDNEPFAQWSKNNDGCISAVDGRELSWKEVYESVERYEDGPESGKLKRGMRDFIRVANMPTQAVCANWMPNLKETCYIGHETDPIFGVQLSCGGIDTFHIPEENEDMPDLNIYSPGGSGRNWYLLDAITVQDGWYHDYFYYSPDGAQSYVLWSAGPNGRTFPPWIDKSGLLDRRVTEIDGSASLTVSDYVKDDIVKMNH